MTDDVKKPTEQFNAGSGANAATSDDGWVLELGSEEYKALLKQDGWTINVESQDATVVAGQHNFISVKAPNGQTLFQFHGLGFNRQTGLEDAAGELAFRATVTSSARPDDITYSEVLMTGSAKEVFSTFAKALKLGEHINNQKLDYIPLGITGAGQNSNSLAHSAVKIMGFEMPEKLMKGWIPGHDRLLIPNDTAGLITFDGQTPELISQAEFDELTNSMTRDSIKEQLLEVKEETGCDIRFFDPDQVYSKNITHEVERTNCGFKPESP